MNFHLEKIKKIAKSKKKKLNINHHEALDFASKEYGCANWKHAQNRYKYNATAPLILGKGTLVHMRGWEQDAMVFSNKTSGLISLCSNSQSNIACVRDDVDVYSDQSLATEFMPLRLWLPYGFWKTKKSETVLFNRNYNPIWIKYSNGVVEKADPYSLIDYHEQKHFFEEVSHETNSSLYWDSDLVVRRAKQCLSDWGITPENLPLNCDMFEKAMKEDEPNLITTSFVGQKPK